MNRERYHFIGIGGAGMSVIAELLHGRGAVVQGSDAKPSATLERLESRGIHCYPTQDASQVPPDHTVVRSTAIKDDNPELATALERGQEIIHRSEALVRAARGLDFVAVAGAHGKTTTSGMLAAALVEAGADPSYAVGGSVLGLGSGARLGSGSVFVAEADESDGSFLAYQPRVAIVTNVEPDHLDHYGSEEAFADAFLQFASRLVDGGLLICCADDAGSAHLAERARSEGLRVATYGRSANADVIVDGDDVFIGEDCYRLSLQVAGDHNRLNAAAALIAGIELGVPAPLMARSLGAFAGTDRRFEPRGYVGGIRVVDDYAHHPTEVAATIATARTQVGSSRVLVLFQPHLFSRTKNFADRFAGALSAADSVVVADIFPAREAPMPGVTSALITEKLPGAEFVPDLTDAAARIASLARPGDIIITMGAGSVTEAGPMILAALAGDSGQVTP
ncbi:UDP-N-acetylmuramate--L-alanine ligase [Bowdeniella nasicola]|uniref:UDP-N-acetylmuramate--L-alanine ligase n=1 Tax=Bowdeniella nasicola TaxID=208480 RepID=A0A1Q5Q2B8_9ACTO|nr:UDP-N-acetylmuramate--L-alanine ligase [Bowdeniella nasicola]OKL53993.1 UDP-N-acetylmuramate--L-alanine ligase [Bowdeniella nasicola]